MMGPTEDCIVEFAELSEGQSFELAVPTHGGNLKGLVLCISLIMMQSAISIAWSNSWRAAPAPVREDPCL